MLCCVGCAVMCWVVLLCPRRVGVEEFMLCAELGIGIGCIMMCRGCNIMF